MSKQLKFLLWPVDGAPMMAESGADSKFADGITIELFSDGKNYVDSNGLSFSDVEFTMSMDYNGQTIASHTFQMEHMNGANIWLIANPALTNPNGSFTAAYAQALCELGAGEHVVAIKLDAAHGGSTTCINEGTICFVNDGTNAQYQALIPLFADADAVRNKANDATQKAYEDKREKEAAEKHAARYFKVKLNNTNDSKTMYIIQKDHKSLSENIKEILPSKSMTIELSRNMTYDLLFYRHDEDKSMAKKLATVNEQSDGSDLSFF